MANGKKQQPKPPETWGVSTADFFFSLREKPIKVVTLDGKVYDGILLGVDKYDIIFKQPDGQLVLMPKHAVKYIIGG
jgi:sRNA-binding regulator protein Hfq